MRISPAIRRRSCNFFPPMRPTGRRPPKMLEHTTPPRKATLSLIVDINEIRDQDEIHIDLRATKTECDALAKDLKILEINDLNSFLTLRKGARPDLFDIEGEILAHVVQECSVTLAPVKETVQESFSEMLTTSAKALETDPD